MIFETTIYKHTAGIFAITAEPFVISLRLI